MTGFTIYETMRIFLPGALAALVLDVCLRLGLATDGFTPQEGSIAANMLGALESVTGYVAVSVVIGLLLYLIDLPERTGVIKGFIGHEARPSNHLKSILNINDGVDRSRISRVAVYFILSDAHLPEELHKRIYLFGAIYKVAVDLRVAVFAGLVVGIPVFLAIKAPASLGAWSWSAALIIAAILGVTAGAGRFAERERQYRIQRRYPEQLDERTSSLTLRPIVTLTALSSLAVLFSSASAVSGWLSPFRWVGPLFGIISLVLWFWLECGPPGISDESGSAAEFTTSAKGEAADRDMKRPLRERYLERKRTGGRQRHPQYRPLHRSWWDMAVLGPTLVGASILGAELGRSGAELLAWGLLIVPGWVIAYSPKHEVRLLGVYESQNTWLDLHAAAIREFVDGDRGLDDLGRTHGN